MGRSEGLAKVKLGVVIERLGNESVANALYGDAAKALGLAGAAEAKAAGLSTVVQ